MVTEVLSSPAAPWRVAPSSWTRERRFFSIMAIALTLVVVAGFAWSTYVRTRPGSTAFGGPTLLPIVRLHAAVSASWMVLLILQTSLIASRRTAMHRRLGVIGGGLACALVVLGWIVAFDLRPLPTSRALGLVPAPGTVEFLILPAEELLVFTTLIGIGLYARHSPAAHKRLMILGTLVLIPAATTRPPLPGSTLMTLGMFGIPEAIFIAALMIHDVRTSGRLHPATIWGGGFVMVAAVSRSWLSHTDLWLAFARGAAQ
jgi:hypothetical protein